MAAIALMGLAGTANARSLVSGLAVLVWVPQCQLLSPPNVDACVSLVVPVQMTLLHCTLPAYTRLFPTVMINSIAHYHPGACAEPSLLRLHPHGCTRQQLWGVPDEVVH